MPLVRIEVVKGRSQEQLDQILLSLHEAMVAAFEVPYRDRYQVLVEHDASHIILEDTGLGFTRSDERILVQVFTRPRSVESKQRFYALCVEYLGDSLGIGPNEVMLTCVENADADWSFGFGRAQFLTGELPGPTIARAH